jgi:hypothetical protein
MFDLLCHAGTNADSTSRPARPLDVESTADVNRLMTLRGIDGPQTHALAGRCQRRQDRAGTRAAEVTPVTEMFSWIVL